MLKKQKGFTLTELLIAILISSFFLFAIFNIIGSIFKNLDVNRKSFDYQSGLRNTSQSISQVIKNSTAIFLIPNEKFSKDQLTERWDYIGVEKNSEGLDEVVVYNYKDDKHVKQVLAPGTKGVEYKIRLTKDENYMENNLLNLSIETYKDGIKQEDLKTEMESISSLQIIDWGTRAGFEDELNGQAIAFRYEERSLEEAKKYSSANVIVVVDRSGSMSSTLDYETGVTITNALRQASTALIDILKDVDGVNLAVFAFDTVADYGVAPSGDSETVAYLNKFYNVKENSDKLYNMFSPLYLSNPYAFNMYDQLAPRGSTNTGDGLRFAYHSLKDHLKDTGSSKNTKNYLILLIDGFSNEIVLDAAKVDMSTYRHDWNWINSNYYNVESFFSYKPGPSLLYYQQGAGFSYDKDTNLHYYYADGTVSANYVHAVARNLYMANQNKLPIETFFINVTPPGSNEYELNRIVNSLNAKRYDSSDLSSLTGAFSDIGNKILEDIWFVDGPVLSD